MFGESTLFFAKGNLNKKLDKMYIYGTLHMRRTLSGYFRLMQNNLGSHWSKFMVNISEFAEDPCLSKYEEKMICSERKSN